MLYDSPKNHSFKRHLWKRKTMNTATNQYKFDLIRFTTCYAKCSHQHQSLQFFLLKTVVLFGLIWFDSVQLKSMPAFYAGVRQHCLHCELKLRHTGVLYAAQSQPWTCPHACEAVGPSVLGLVLVLCGGIPNLILKGDRQRHTVCLALDKYSHDIQTACSLASQFILAGARSSDAPAVCKLTKPSLNRQGIYFSFMGCTIDIDWLSQVKCMRNVCIYITHKLLQVRACLKSRENAPVVVLTIKTLASQNRKAGFTHCSKVSAYTRAVVYFTRDQHSWHKKGGNLYMWIHYKRSGNIDELRVHGSFCTNIRDVTRTVCESYLEAEKPLTI